MPLTLVTLVILMALMPLTLSIVSTAIQMHGTRPNGTRPGIELLVTHTWRLDRLSCDALDVLWLFLNSSSVLSSITCADINENVSVRGGSKYPFLEPQWILWGA